MAAHLEASDMGTGREMQADLPKPRALGSAEAMHEQHRTLGTQGEQRVVPYKFRT